MEADGNAVTDGKYTESSEIVADSLKVWDAIDDDATEQDEGNPTTCLLYTSPSPRD